MGTPELAPPPPVMRSPPLPSPPAGLGTGSGGTVEASILPVCLSSTSQAPARGGKCCRGTLQRCGPRAKRKLLLQSPAVNLRTQGPVSCLPLAQQLPQLKKGRKRELDTHVWREEAASCPTQHSILARILCPGQSLLGHWRPRPLSWFQKNHFFPPVMGSPSERLKSRKPKASLSLLPQTLSA